MDEQHWFTGHLTLEEVNQATPLKEDVQFTSSDTKLTLVIKSPLTAALIDQRVPHLNAMGRGLLLKGLQIIPIDQLDVNSLRETQLEFNSINREVAIRNYTTNTFSNHIIIDEEEYVPHHVDEKTKIVTLRYKYPYRYSVASADYAKEVNEANAKFESDYGHAVKLLYELPIALENSKRKLAEDTTAVLEKATDMELTALGALNVEQARIEKEIKCQKERLTQLKQTYFDKSKFISQEFQWEIHLPFGWHQFNDILYELIHTPMPSEAEINSLTQMKEAVVEFIKCTPDHEVNNGGAVAAELIKIGQQIFESGDRIRGFLVARQAGKFVAGGSQQPPVVTTHLTAASETSSSVSSTMENSQSSNNSSE